VSEDPSPDQLRAQARELKQALDEGSVEARERVLASHPKFAGRPAERMEGWVFRLGDAQATVAREQGYDSWKALLEALEVDEVTRWGEDDLNGSQRRAFKEARLMGHGFCTAEHFLLALLSPPESTAAAEVLTGLGLSYQTVSEHAERLAASPQDKGEGSRSTAMSNRISGTARGIAIGMGSTRTTDEHVLLAMCYDEHVVEGPLTILGIDPDDVMTGLREHDVPVPEVGPRVKRTPIGPLGPWVYFPEEDFGLVTQAIVKHYPPRTVHWGTNQSTWKTGYWYVQGEDEIPMEQIVRSAVTDPSTVIVLGLGEGAERERDGRASSE
jgi:hypothetical protein